jgi:hypothetical protein
LAERLHAQAVAIESYHSNGDLFDPNPGRDLYSKVDITVGEPGEAYVMVKPQIGSILAGKYRFSFPQYQTLCAW